VIIFGGGWGPEGNQRSLEVQVSALRDALSKSDPIVLFAGGEGAKVQHLDPEEREADRWLGLIFDRPDSLGIRYESARIAPRGAASRTKLLAAIDEAVARGGPLAVFGVGHGSRPADDASALLELWGPPAEALSAEELATHLDDLKPKAPIAFVLGQCHSGAFWRIVFEGAKTEPAVPARCVLAAIPPEREAAGCTP